MSYVCMINSFQNASYKIHFHSTYSISLILEGECDINIEGKRYKVSKNDIRVVNPYELHEIKSSSWTHKNLVLDTFAVFKLLEKEAVFQNVIRDEKIASFLKEKKIDIKKLLEHLFLYYGYKNKTVKDLKAKKLEKAISYIRKNADKQTINVSNIAFYAGFSKYHFIREFKKETGLTPYHYIHNIKINRARELIGKGEPLSQVAQICGFTDQSHFIKIYKKFYGHTPSKVSNNLLY